MMAKSFLSKCKGTPVKTHKLIKKFEEEGILNLCYT
jgi:NAD-dependent SIR2 family protein deacetylase